MFALTSGPALLWYVASALVCDKEMKIQETHLWERLYAVQFLSARRCTFEHCTSCCPSRDTTRVFPVKKNERQHKTPLTTLYGNDLLTVEGLKCGRQNVLSVKAALCGKQ